MSISPNTQASQVSCVIPTHGRPLLLAGALQSIRDQTTPPLEVLVVDDLGDEATRDLVASLGAGFPSALTYVFNDKTPGACGSRNLGAQRAGGSLLAFLDDDDVWAPEFLAECVAALRDPGAQFALTYIERVYPDGTIKALTTTPGLTKDNVLHQRVNMTGSSFVIRQADFLKVGGFDTNVPVFNDWDLFIRLVRAGQRYAVVPRNLVRWVEHDGPRITTSSVRRADGIDRFLGVYGRDMSPAVRGYFVRIAYGIRKSHEASRLKRLGLTLRMFAAAGWSGSRAILKMNLTEKAG